MKRLLLLFAIFTSVNFSQTAISKFTICEEGKDYYYSSLLELPDQSQIFIFSEGDSLYSSRSFDGGETWKEKKYIKDISIELFEQKNFDAIVTPDSSILIISVSGIAIKATRIHKSVDYGETWEEIKVFRDVFNSSFSVINDSTIWMLFSEPQSFNNGIDPFETNYLESKDNGNSWIPITYRKFLADGEILNIVPIKDSVIFGTSTKVIENEQYNKLFGIFSYDNGKTWSDEIKINTVEDDIINSELFWKNDSLILVYSTGKVNVYSIDPTRNNSTIKYIVSEDSAVTWGEPITITEYAGINGLFQTNKINNKFYTTFFSDRFNKSNIYIAELGNSIDSLSPPKIILASNYDSLFTTQTLKVNLEILDNQIDGHKVEILFGTDKNYLIKSEMTYLGNNFYYSEFGGYEDGDTLYYKIVVSDNENFLTETKLNHTKFYSDGYEDLQSKALVKINNFALPINNIGTLGDVLVRDLEGDYYNGEYFDGGRFREKVVLFSSGFGLSGFDENNNLWANASISVFRIADYIQGTVDATDSNKFVIYKVSKSDSAFGDSWKRWKDAVSLGAYYYDGDNDGVYNPVDKNNNGIWDSNEDKPDILGHQTFWTVFNDGKPSVERRYPDQSPKGIEIRQTIWGFNEDNGLNNTLFVRYSILSKNENLDDVVFSVISDPDLGSAGTSYADDLTGCDTLLNTGFVYNDSSDVDFGDDPPAIFTSLLQGPRIESNYDSYSYNRKGLLGIDSTNGYENGKMSSFLSWIKTAGLDSPNETKALRNFMEAKNQIGEYIEPCDFPYGEVYNYDCQKIDPKYHYSGDPVNKNGWVMIWPLDAKMFINSSKFTLEKDKPVDLILAYIIGDGESSLNSVEVGKKYAREVKAFYESNFIDYVVSINEEKRETIPSKFTLSQNYPNPFNPTTTIEYSIPISTVIASTSTSLSVNSAKQSTKNVTLQVFDILGREVTTLVNEKQTAGNYKVTFDASNLSSGIYFYKLQTGQNILTKKMILLK